MSSLKSRVPNSWDEVYLDQFVELIKINDKELSFYDKQIEIISVLLDIMPDDDIWDDIDTSELNDVMRSIKWTSTEPTNNFSESIGNYKCIDIDSLTFGEFIDIDFLFADDSIGNLNKICSIFYRKYKYDEWNNLVYEPYGKYDLDLRKLEFDELPITSVYGIIKKYKEYKLNIERVYETIFEPNISDDDLDDDYIEEVYDSEEKVKIEAEELMRHWGWENVLYKLADGDITKYDSITNLSLIFVLNQLSFIKDMKL
jgi:hypothetical protein